MSFFVCLCFSFLHCLNTIPKRCSFLLDSFCTAWPFLLKTIFCFVLHIYRYSYRDSYGQSRGDDRSDGYRSGAASRGDYMATRSDMRDSPRDSYPPRGGDGYSSMSREYREPLSSRGGDRFDRCVVSVCLKILKNKGLCVCVCVV